MFGGYATHWVADRRLQSRSRELNAMLLRLHIMPWFGDLALDRITPPMVRSWRTDLLRQGRNVRSRPDPAPVHDERGAMG